MEIEASDLELLEASLSGDKQSEKLFVLRHYGKLFNYIARALGQHSGYAEDVSQEVWIKWGKYCRSGKKGADQLGVKYLYSIAKTSVIDFFRTHKQYLSLDDNDRELQDETAPSSALDEEALELQSRIEGLIEKPKELALAELRQARTDSQKKNALYRVNQETEKANGLLQFLHFVLAGHKSEQLKEIFDFNDDQVKYRLQKIREYTQKARVFD